MGKKHTRSVMNDYTDDALMRNKNEFLYYLTWLKNIWMSCIEFENLPDSINPRYMMKGFLEPGYMLYFIDDTVGDLCMKCTYAGPFTFYDIPIYRHAYSEDGIDTFERTDLDSVLIWANYTRTPDIYALFHYAYKLAEISRIIDVNLHNQRFSTIITSTEEQRLTFINLVEKWEGNLPFIFADKNLDMQGLQTINMNAQNNTLDLYELWRRVWSEAMNFIGIENYSTVKKERETAGEVQGNMGSVETSRNTKLQALQLGFDQVNRKFGRNIKVHWKSNIISPLNTPDIYKLSAEKPSREENIENSEITKSEGGEDDERLHNASSMDNRITVRKTQTTDNPK